MGSQLCKQVPGSEPENSFTSDIYLSNPVSVTKNQIRKSAGTKTPNLAGSYVGPETSLILGCKEDQRRQLMNKYMLTYLYFLRNKSGDAEIEINDFYKLLKILDEDKEFASQIEQFQKQYSQKFTPKQKAEFLISQYFKNGFYSSAIQKFPIYSSDPSILGYARRPIVDLNKGIKSKYDKQGRKKEIYCVIQLPKEEEKLLETMAQRKDYFMFSTFVRCFSNEGKARKRLKELEKIGKDIRESYNLTTSTILLNIQIPNQQVDQDYDYGFYQDESQKQNPLGDIIMNILNFFSVTGSEPQNKTYDLKYNSLARLIFMRRERLLSSEPELLKVTTLIEGQCQEIKTHSGLIRLVANRRLSITASQMLKKSFGLRENREDNERINLIEAYLEQKSYDKALEECKDKTTPQFMVRKAQILYEANKEDQAQTILKNLEPSKINLKKQSFKEYVLYEFICAKIKKKKGEIQHAKKHLQILSDAMKKQYKGNYEYRGREVQRELDQCNRKEGESVQPESNSIKVGPGVKWEKYSDGLNISVMLSH